MKKFLPPLDGLRMIVTGASQGVGEGIARVVTAQGADVLITHEPTQKFTRRAEKLVRELRKAGLTVSAFPLDLSSRESIDACVRHAWRRNRRVDVLVNNAFWWSNKRFEEHAYEDFERFAIVDVTGLTYWTQQILIRMREARVPGSVINITSVHQETIRRLHPTYSALKAALAMLTKELAVEYAPYGIRVNAVAPGHVETDPAKVRAGKRARNRFIPLRARSALPGDIGKAVAAFASPDLFPQVTGVTLFVDGGERLFGEWVVRIPPGTS